ncbi:MAG: hypothetical protein HY544_05265 [Candidatus Diapherotrites archaeon]|uniref:Uncharacterized protein n=1 Tax=Candidatus Iainarchaeum sp. TaxID=3101447 RepID=A0A8T3YM73_9ARCH|nr:hypothetical protein [Candidatus Diapherotrites archaeon]
MYFGVAVKALFWAFVLQMFLLFLDISTGVVMKDLTFTLFGFFVCYVGAFVYVLNVSLSADKK